MPEYFTFKNGKSKGKTIEQVAATDYLTLKWIYDNVLKGNNPFTKRVSTVLHRLNNFVPQVNCVKCGDTARKISVGTSRYGVSVSSGYVYCAETYCLESIKYERAKVYPIRFEILTDLKSIVTKNDLKEIQEVLVECSGLTGNKTKHNCKEWIDNLVLSSIR